ncbi:hypothetical protein [Borreliella turdi]|uniref:hypothetical protein n=1 Tax=Borreliella turdi TaxID=57863 RepID=UPI001246E523|nr:hypothetical protein [Borreliella turdi]
MKKVLNNDKLPLAIEYNKEKINANTASKFYKLDFQGFFNDSNSNLFRYFTVFNLKLVKPGKVILLI